MEQMFLFGVTANSGVAPLPRTPNVRRNFGPAPSQKALRIKLMRKIAFKHRIRELPGVGNNYDWTLPELELLHQEVLKDWEERFPTCTNLAEQIDFWTWMLGDPDAPFSFRDCLIADGYPRPDQVIEAVAERAPVWFVRMQHLPPQLQVRELKKLVVESSHTDPARRLAA